MSIRASGPFSFSCVRQTTLLLLVTAAVVPAQSPFASTIEFAVNQGDGGMPWTADILAGAEFLSATPPSGVTIAGSSSNLTIAPQTAAKPNASDLAAGNYYGL